MRTFAAALVICAAALTACSGGSRSAPPGAQAGTAQFAFTFYNPALSARRRTPAFLSPDTRSITIALNGASDPLLFQIVPGASFCNNALTVCGISVSAPAGANTFTINVYRDAFARGTLLGTQTLSATIPAGGTQTIGLAIAGVPALAKIAFASGSGLQQGVAGSAALTVSVYDPAGNLIIGPYAAPVPVTLIDPTQSTTLSAASVDSSAAGLTLAYNGSRGFTRATVQTGTAAGTVQSADTIVPAGAPALAYVSAPLGNAVYAYPVTAKGPTPPALTLAGPATQLNTPEGIAFDAAGALYVLSAPAGAPHAITVYAAGAVGNSAPLRTIAGPKTLLDNCYGEIAVDASGTIIAHGAKAIFTFAAGATGNAAPASVLASPAVTPPLINGLALDAGGNLYAGAGGAILIFAPGAKGAAAPIGSISGPATELAAPTTVKLDAAGTIYVNDTDPSGTIWPNGYALSAFAPGTRGNTAPTRAVTGPSTSLGGQQALAVDAAGYQYVVAPYGTPRILVFAPQASADAAPLQVIKDPSFQFPAGPPLPMAIALH